ncbi:hypothetical protein D9M71_307480 [compost metagenome]
MALEQMGNGMFIGFGHEATLGRIDPGTEQHQTHRFIAQQALELLKVQAPRLAQRQFNNPQTRRLQYAQYHP